MPLAFYVSYFADQLYKCGLFPSPRPKFLSSVLTDSYPSEPRKQASAWRNSMTSYTRPPSTALLTDSLAGPPNDSNNQ